MVIRLICYGKGGDREKRKGLEQEGSCRMQRTLDGSGSIYSPNKCFLSTYYVLLTVIAFKVKIMNKAETVGQAGAPVKQAIAIWSERLVGGKSGNVGAWPSLSLSGALGKTQLCPKIPPGSGHRSVRSVHIDADGMLRAHSVINSTLQNISNISSLCSSALLRC